MQAARVLFSEMRDCFRYIEPVPRNFATFGHELRNLLILACTEVESAWKAILRANDATIAPDARLTTNRYVGLLGPMRLAEWEIAVPGHPEVPAFRPFGAWRAAAPTESLDWYNAYNAVKHDRENGFCEATLERAIHACGAAFVMVTAQFGLWRDTGTTRLDPVFHQTQFPHDFTFVTAPTWTLEEHYIPPEVDGRTAWTVRQLF
jgi:hypothetical protein